MDRIKDNFQLERFDDKDKRDARYRELRDRGRAGVLKLSVGEWTTIQEIRRLPAPKKGPLSMKGPTCGYVEGRFAVDVTVPVWAVAYPREIPVKKRRRSRRFPDHPLQSQRHKRARYFRRHPGKAGNFGATMMVGRPTADSIRAALLQKQKDSRPA